MESTIESARLRAATAAPLLEAKGDGFVATEELGITAGVSAKGACPTFEELIERARRRKKESSGADIIAVGSLNYVGKRYYLNIKLIQVENSEIVGSSIAEADGDTEFFDMCSRAVYALF